MRGLNLAKNVGLKICECQKIFAPVTCKISLNDVENLIQQKFKNSGDVQQGNVDEIFKQACTFAYNF